MNEELMAIAIIETLVRDFGSTALRDAMSAMTGASPGDSPAPPATLLNAIVKALLAFVGETFITQRIDRWEAARVAADVSEDMKFGPTS